jgi:hypothetical protein
MVSYRLLPVSSKRAKQTKMATSFKLRIGVKEIAAMHPHTILWDLEVKGFCARRQNDVITYSVLFRTRENVQKWFKIGRHPILTPHLARQEAIRILREVALGKDPSKERHDSDME